MTTTIIELPKITDPRGNLTFAQHPANIPFNIQRTYWLYDVPAGESRGGHAHKQCRELLIALSGSFHVTLDDGNHQETVLLNHPWQGLLIETHTWRTLNDFSAGAICLVLASHPYDPDDYIYDYKQFKEQAGKVNEQEDSPAKL